MVFWTDQQHQPLHTIDVRTLNGSPFVPLMVLEKLVEQRESMGLQSPEARRILNDYNKMSFDDVLDAIARVSNGDIVFTGREK